MQYENERYIKWVEDSAAYIRRTLGGFQPELAIVLGSGLGGLADRLQNPIPVEYADIPGFPRSTVAGHAGRFVAGYIGKKPVICMQGRFHYYEGYDLRTVTLPVRVLHALGVDSIILTNAAGGVNLSFVPGDLMVIDDHINLTGQSPLIGPNLEGWGQRFTDLSTAEDKEDRAWAHQTAAELGFSLQSGVYTWMTGPTYETPAEIRMVRTLGGDAVGMSTVPEAMVARHMGMRVLGISCITNMAAGILDQPLSHEEVSETAGKVTEKFTALIEAVAQAI